MNIKALLARALPAAVLFYVLTPFAAQAAPLTSRSLTFGSSAIGVITTHTINFSIPTSGNIGSIKFEYCDTAYAACVTPAGLSTTSATLSAQSGVIGFTLVNATNGVPYLTRSSSSVTAPVSVSYTLSNITNPTTPNVEYWTRITTYASTNISGGLTDNGVVAWGTTNQIVISGTMPESLVFCVGTSGTDCSNMTGSAVSLGVFSPVATSTGTSLMSASTNAGSGYAITINGTTLTSGSNNIPAMGTQSGNSSACSPSCSSSTGTSQFGTNLRANTTPAIGAGVSGPGTATGFNGYNINDSFRFVSGDEVASAAGVTKANLLTNSYIVNVGGDQAAGVYTATMTYICTATF
jgi:hypothetical protein